MTTAGCAIWATGFAWLGALAGRGWAALSGPVGNFLLALGAMSILLALRAANNADD
jgi:membrane protein DedA with SNARE-associated domain